MARSAEKPLPASPRRRGNLARTFFAGIRITAILLAVTVVGIIAGTVASIAPGLPDTEGLDSWVPNQTTRILSSDGELLAQLYTENREFVPVTEVPESLQHATVAIEDERFYHHVGADPKALLRAVVNNIRSKDIYGQGGSTITEQLAKNIYLHQKKNFARRLQQMIMALKIERRYSKEEILEMYLNEVCYGNGAFGVQAAAKLYFGKPAKDLTLAEAALLAGLPRRPTYYSPFDNYNAAKERQELVLTKMAEQGYVGWDEADAAAQETLKINSENNRSYRKFKKPYFVTYAIKELVSRYGVDMVYKGGLQVYTTLDMKVQDAAEQAIREGLGRVGGRNVSQGALACIKVNDGRILALVGGRDFDKSQWNRATQARRQPGSSFKPYLYATAMDNGFSPNSVVSDSPVSYPGGNGRMWSPRNYDGRYRGTVTLRRAVAMSINVVAVKVMDEVGPARVIETARRMGIRSPLDPYLSLALGASGVTLLEHTAAYAAFASGGLRAEPTTVLKVLDHTGHPIDTLVPRVERVLSPSTAAAVRSMLMTAVESGTGRNARIPGYQVGGKTGTTSSGKDAWFMGFTPELVCGVWMGNDHNERMYNPSGGFFCAPVWKQLMVQALAITHSEKRRFDESVFKTTSDRNLRARNRKRTLTICDDSGLLATDACPNVHTQEFPAGKGPRRSCNLHGSSASNREEYLTVCGDSGQLATENCPNPVLRSFRAGDAPSARCSMHDSSAGREASEGTPRRAIEPPKPALTQPEQRPAPALPPPAIPDEGTPQ